MLTLVLNAGSSSHKAALFDLCAPKPNPLWQAQLDWTHQVGAVKMRVKTVEGEEVRETLATEDKATGLGWMLDTLWQGATPVISSLGAIQAVGHRVVHGGQAYQQSVLITPAVKGAIHDLFPLAPAHNPANLDGIETLEQLLPGVPQVAVFDTAFHSTLGDRAALYPVPYDWVDQGIRRYGFHGISHQYVAQRAAELLGQPLADLRLITCHLGNGCSLAAVRGGVSVDTTMGFTPLDGVMMGSRSGAIDPGILIHLMRHKGLSADDLDRLLNKEAGLKGVSGLSNDMRQILEAAAAGHVRAQLAFDMFIHSLRRNIGAMVGNLGGLDALVFTAGIGENSPEVWQGTCEGWEFLGLRLDPKKLERATDDRDIAAPNAAVRVLVIHTQEEWAIAQECYRVLTSAQLS